MADLRLDTEVFGEVGGEAAPRKRGSAVHALLRSLLSYVQLIVFKEPSDEPFERMLRARPQPDFLDEVIGCEPVEQRRNRGKAGQDIGDNAEVQRRRRLALQVARRSSEEHTSALQSLMRISYDVFCLKINNQHNTNINLHELDVLN